MGRRKLVAGNWKMNTTSGEASLLVSEVLNGLGNVNCDVTIFPPYLFLEKIAEQCSGSKVEVGAQNCSSFSAGAYTGEVSVSMLSSVGAKAVLIGHSERRTYFGESSKVLSEKVKLAIEAGLTPYFCIGEVLIERESGKHFEVVKQQLSETVFHFSPSDFEKMVIAYEPVWAIGTGKTASAQDAQDMHAYIRSLVAENMGSSVAAKVRILYGGSCNASNAASLFSMPDVDGGLIGGASLKSADFLAIINSAN